MTSNYRLTPVSQSNFASRPLTHKMVDRTEYSVNRRILSKMFCFGSSCKRESHTKKCSMKEFGLRSYLILALSNHLYTTFQVFESDLVLTKPQMDEVMDNFNARITGRRRRNKRNAAIIGKKFRWPNAVIPYEFKDSDSNNITVNAAADWKKLIWRGMKEWQKETCIRFVERTNETDYAVFFKGAGCYSNVGRTGGRQYISIGWGCESRGIVAHEIGHALGFWHEQSRPDRDQFININEDAISSGTKGNFEKRSDIMDSDIPYDFGSVMHYAPQAFTKDWHLVTIETKDHRFQHTIGQRSTVSFTDVKHANRLYCSRVCQTKISCANGGYQDPRNCDRCKCPPGLGGVLCERVADSTPGCGGELFASSQWQILQNSQIGTCHWRIYVCSHAICSFPYFYPSFNVNLQAPNGRISFETQCCNPAPGRTVSHGNQVIVTSFSKTAPSNFTMRYILANEVGIDNTFETLILKDVPRVLGRSRGGPNFASLFGLLDTFLPRGPRG
ncbi:unnamed protein product [Haemonchus placei]|uniref:Metalloendopeptidase n=1 Tax=Haemonchus placei TaxID=6290 RepID=A0A0N4W0K1_HAEPC|nr:unnamed protein product [Haemonchus placei]